MTPADMEDLRHSKTTGVPAWRYRRIFDHLGYQDL
jgi:hypothetical protein